MRIAVATLMASLAASLAASCGQGSGAAAVSGTTTTRTTIVLDTVRAVIGSPFNLRIGQSAKLGTTGVLFALRELREDSRCPVGAQCVSAGNAQIVVETRSAAGATGQAILNLTANSQFPSATTVDGLDIRFQSLTPVPQAGTTIARDSYVATFLATGA